MADYAAAHHLIPKRGVNVKNILLGDLPDGIGGASAGEGVVSHLVHCGEEFPAVYAVLRERGYLHRPAQLLKRREEVLRGGAVVSAAGYADRPGSLCELPGSALRRKSQALYI